MPWTAETTWHYWYPMHLISPEFGFAAFTGVLPTDQADEVVDSGVGDGNHRHRVNFLLSHRQVDVDLLGSRRADVTLKGHKKRKKTLIWFVCVQCLVQCEATKKHSRMVYLAIKFRIFVKGVIELLGTLFQSHWKCRFDPSCPLALLKVPFLKQWGWIVNCEED